MMRRSFEGRWKWILLLPVLLLFGYAANSAAGSDKPKTESWGIFGTFDVPYVPTPQEVVEEMLRMARIKPKDIVYDLGSGDGRILITAAREFGARGVGVEIEPKLVRLSKKNALRAGVADRVSFLQQDLFKIDLREATVVTLYLHSEVNLELRPRLLRDLRPGTRVVSHNYAMLDWEPDIWQKMRVYSDHHLYYWIIPANASGVWEWTAPSDLGGGKYLLELEQKFQRVEARAMLGKLESSVKQSRLVGDRLECLVEQHTPKGILPLRFEGRVRGDSIKGTVTLVKGEERNGKGRQEVKRRSWTAKRDPTTIKPLYGSD